MFNHPLELVKHDPNWASLAQREGLRLKTALRTCLIRVEHIGSTAIPGIDAKPIIDLLPIVTSVAELDEKRADIEALGYEWRGEYGIPGRRYCILNNAATGKRVFNVHFLSNGSTAIAPQIAFRDYLREVEPERLAYQAEKRRACDLHRCNRRAYQEEKSIWIAECEQRALRWANRMTTGRSI